MSREGARSPRSGAQTLGERLAALRPGDPCPCCGGTLRGRPVRTATKAASAGTAPGHGEPDALLCVRCGCEISPLEGADAGALCRRISAAA
jgi:hypothetical protein